MMANLRQTEWTLPAWRGHQGDRVRSTDKDQIKARAGDVATDGKPSASGDGQIGDALRAVYSEAVQEQIPDDLLDLLRKLD